MNIRERVAAMLGFQTSKTDDTRVRLDREEARMAGRLSRLTGRRRDEVLAEAYRRADRILAERGQ